MISCMLLFACKPGIPSDIIQPDKMEKVLFDIHVVDGYIVTIVKQDSAKIIASAYYKGIYKKFDIDSALYAKSMNYYYGQPDVLDKMYDKVAKNLEKEKLENDLRVQELARIEHNKLMAKSKKYLTVDSQTAANIPIFNFGYNPFQDITMSY
jgi:hypothetical protein